MNQFKKTTLRLTVIYSLVFFCFIWAFSGGLYIWTNNSFGEGYVNRINAIIEQINTQNHSPAELSDNTATIAADVALDRLRNIILLVNGFALIVIPTLAFLLSRQSLKPLIRSQAEQQQFISNASHELRTPLAVMSGELELAVKQPRTSQEYVRTIKNTKEEVERMTRLVRELLLLTRMNSSGKHQDTTIVDPKELLYEIFDLYKAKADDKDVTVNIRADTNAMIVGRSDLLMIALGNLLDNAIKFSDAKAPVVVHVTRIKNNIMIEFKNKGQAIEPDKLSHLFERFYQANTDHTVDSFGLGLAIAKQVIELHNGVIEAKSHNGETAFRVTLPSSTN
jgi:signal transduction histidine kinase